MEDDGESRLAELELSRKREREKESHRTREQQQQHRPCGLPACLVGPPSLWVRRRDWRAAGRCWLLLAAVGWLLAVSFSETPPPFSDWCCLAA